MANDQRVAITPAMRKWCRYLAQPGVTLTRYTNTQPHHAQGGRGDGTKTMTYPMGRKLTEAGLITWTDHKTLHSRVHYQRAALTERGLAESRQHG